ncbi:class I SAM-dependent methyltransferase [Salinibacillus aidingensis]|uniref:Class I SAM-dependent methyltransferase n=1 Tax=Salinibacillus aidingensis TaxID=237684 RepID=A0ABN1B8C3_9BACI
MGIDFHNDRNRFKYAFRHVDSLWMDLVKSLVPIENTSSAADIGCGGGIYTKALLKLGVNSVTGVDFSLAMIEGAKEASKGYQNLSFQHGSAYESGLKRNAYDLVLERALIHHIKDLYSCFQEAYQLLNNGGNLIVQDRTPEDCLLPGSQDHVRGYFFDCYLKLKDIELKRRYTSTFVTENLKRAGFKEIEEVTLWETRRVYETKHELLNDIKNRTGRSILFELENDELKSLIDYMDKSLPMNKKITEKDRWTIWKAVK